MVRYSSECATLVRMASFFSDRNYSFSIPSTCTYTLKDANIDDNHLFVLRVHEATNYGSYLTAI